ncbi:MAG TPA: putative lipid II flippase FtsW [Candidatus Saccharimonadia bacterium]|nr:putative lipid II flippase FtsW [Candidatus Saccharimonadia bacterium]
MKKHILAIVLCITILVALGVLFVFDASVAEAFQNFNDKFYFAKQQIFWAGTGMIALWIASLLPMKFYKAIGMPLFFGSLVLLVAVLIPGIGTTVQGAQRWIVLGPARFQPAELTKIGMILYFSQWLLKKQHSIPFLTLTGAIFLLLLKQPDLGTALILGAIAVSIFIGAGGSWKSIAGVGIFGIIGVLALIIISPYRMQRLEAFQNPDKDPLGASYHIRQITIALGSGGLFGQGIGQSRQKYQYIPEASTDSIFAITAEEIGFVGALAVLGLYILVIWHGFRISEHATDQYSRLVALGIVTWIGMQTILNLGSIVALVPLTGVPLPYISYGGSSLISILAASGILIGIGKRSA